MLETVKEALVYLDAPPGSGFGRPRALRDYWSSHHTVLAPTNNCLLRPLHSAPIFFGLL
jgi:hypothetical protein